MMRDSIAVTLAAVLALLAALHVFWAFRGEAAGAVIPTRPDGTPLFRPSRAATLAVAAALVVAMMLVLGRVDLALASSPAWVSRVGIWGVVAAFAARAVGDFRYAGLFKREQGTAFARMDTLVFTPLCIAMAVAATAVAVS